MKQNKGSKLMSEFIKADNMYRTKNHIIAQHIIMEDAEEEGMHLCSYDTFYPRNTENDMLYEKEYGELTRANGKRIRVSKCARNYEK